MKKWISKISYQKRRAIFSFLFVLPWIVGFVLFSLKPIYDLFTYSFSRTHFLPDASIQLDYVGLGNYDTILITETTFITNLLDYLSQIALMLPAIVVFGLLIALLLNSSIPCRRLFRVLFFLPVVLIQGTLLSTIRELNAMSIAGVDAMFVFTFIRNQLPEWLSN
ncbi:MAG: sugar ABC transporter permease, partial [Clostridia bacterium]|nr:sugar ABC transporter permease [Clostridia bacterium]